MADDLGDIWWETEETDEKKSPKKGKNKSALKSSTDDITLSDSGREKSLKRKIEKCREDQKAAKSRKTDLSLSGGETSEHGHKKTDLITKGKGRKGKENNKKKQKKSSKSKVSKEIDPSGVVTGSAETKSARKKERKRISEVPDDELSRPGTAEDLRSIMTKQLKDRLGGAALEDSLPNPETDFFGNNDTSLEPSDYLKSILPSWREVVKKSLYMKNLASPSLLIITSSAIRAVELNRDIKEFVTEKGKVAKLFAKHMKLEEQKKFLAKTNIQVGIGTPGRLSQLIKQGSLQLESLVGVVLDWNWRDQKLKRMSDIPEVRAELVGLIKDFLLETVEGSSCKFGLL